MVLLSLLCYSLSIQECPNSPWIWSIERCDKRPAPLWSVNGIPVLIKFATLQRQRHQMPNLPIDKADSGISCKSSADAFPASRSLHVHFSALFHSLSWYEEFRSVKHQRPEWNKVVSTRTCQKSWLKIPFPWTRQELKTHSIFSGTSLFHIVSEKTKRSRLRLMERNVYRKVVWQHLQSRFL